MILVDTHVVAWLAFDQDQLSRKARAAIDDARKNGEGLAISDITLFELAALVNRGRIRLDISLESFLREVEARLSSYRSRDVHACVPLDFQPLIQRTQQIVSSVRPRWSRGYLCSLQTVRSAGRKHFRRSGEKG